MRRRTHKLFLILLTLALAVAPLRGAWGAADLSPATASEGSTTHCEQMQHGNPADAAMTGMHAGHDSATTDSAPCSRDCGGSCCDGACNACVHATPAIPGTITVLSGTTAGTPTSTPSQLYPERPAIPLLQPPASSHS